MRHAISLLNNIVVILLAIVFMVLSAITTIVGGTVGVLLFYVMYHYEQLRFNFAPWNHS